MTMPLQRPDFATARPTEGRAERSADSARTPNLVALPQLESAPKPRVRHAVTFVVGVAAIVVAQLGISAMLANGAYELQELEARSAELGRAEQHLGETLASLEAPQNVSAAAEAAGMQYASEQQLLSLSTGAVTAGADALLHAPTARDGGGSLAVPNGVLEPQEQLAAQQAQTAATAQAQREAAGYPGMVLPAEGVVPGR